MRKIVLTGGGTLGHVTPNIALLPALKAANYEVIYIGSNYGMEKEIIKKHNIKYFGISSGKFRRYFSLKNFTDPFRVIKGFFEAKKILQNEKPNLVFSKGGFVSVPVVLAAKILKIPVIIHESDMTPGLANRIASCAATYFCCNFPETFNSLPKGKTILSGTPIREFLLNGSAKSGHDFLNLNYEKPIIMIIGGSQGSKIINDTVRSALPFILDRFYVVHLCGKGNIDDSLKNTEGYRQYEFISDELPDIFAASDLVISRAGANAICEILSLKKPNILIPLGFSQSRGDQILNADSFKKQGFSYVINEENLTEESLIIGINTVFSNRLSYIEDMQKASESNSVQIIMDLINKL